MFNFYKNWYYTSILLFATVLSSCGFVSDSPPSNTEIYKSTEMQTCKIDIDRLSQFLVSVQKDQIYCIQDSFLQYTKFVKSSSQTSIHENELRDFVNKLYPGQSDAITKALSIIFQFNMLLLRDERGQISNDNIIPFFQFLTTLNQEAVTLNTIIKEMNSQNHHPNFWKQRTGFNLAIERFTTNTLAILNTPKNENQLLNLQYFALDIIKNFNIKNVEPDTVETFLFIKKLLIGGDKDFISSDDFRNLVLRLPETLNLFFDMKYAKESNFGSDEDFAKFNLLNTRKLFRVLEFNQPDFKLFVTDDILHSLSRITKNNNYNKFNNGIESIKSKILGGDVKSFYLKDIKNLLNIYHDYSEKNYFNIVTYDGYQDILNSNEPINSLEQLDLPQKYHLFSKDRIAELHHNFTETAIKTRYYINEDSGIPYIGNEIRRNKYGFISSSFATFATTHLIKGYGSISNDGQLQLSSTEFKIFLDTLEPILREFNLWSPDKFFYQSSVLMSDLFQNNSNGNLLVNPTEATEYAQLAIAATSLSKKLNTELLPICNIGLTNDDPRFETKCFNENIFDKIFNELDMKEYLPNLYRYVESASLPEQESFLTAVEDFAREYPSPQNPIDKRDSGLIVGSLLNIESVFLRFDTNGDNILDYEELGKAYEIFKGITIDIAKLKPNQEVFAKSVFLYMITKSKPPPSGTWTKSVKFFTYHKCVSSKMCREIFLKKVQASRLQIGQLLSYVAKSKRSTPPISDEEY